MTTMHALRSRVIEDLASMRRAIDYARICREGVETDFWKKMERHLLGEEEALLAWILEVDASEAEFRELRAAIKCFRRLRTLPQVSETQLVELEKQEANLRRRLAQLEELGVDERAAQRWDELRRDIQQTAARIRL